MEMTAKFRTNFEQILAYRKERFDLRLFLPFSLYLTVVSQSASSLNLSLLQYTITFGLSLTLLFQFRLWDDLFDIDYDRRNYPHRILSRQSRLSPFWSLSFGVAALNAFLVQLLAAHYFMNFVLFAVVFFCSCSFFSRFFTGFPGRFIFLWSNIHSSSSF